MTEEDSPHRDAGMSGRRFASVYELIDERRVRRLFVINRSAE